MRTRRGGCTAFEVTGCFFSLLFLLAVLLVLPVMACAAPAADSATPDEQARAAAEWRRRVHEPRHEGFVLVKVGSLYEPMLHYYQPFELPHTHLAFAPCTYILPLKKGEKERKKVPKFVFRLDDGRFSYVKEPAASEGDAHYALTNGYFIVDGDGGVSDGRSMYLFTYDKDSVRLLDMVGAAPDQDFDFMSDYPGEPAYGRKTTEGEKHAPEWIIKDADCHGNPLMRISVFMKHFDDDLFESDHKRAPRNVEGPRDSPKAFPLYLRIVTRPGGRARLRVALDPDLYKPLFEAVDEASKESARPAQYYILGFLSGQMDLTRIEAEMPDNTASWYIEDILKDVGNWDASLHYRSGKPIPKIVEYRLKRR